MTLKTTMKTTLMPKRMDPKSKLPHGGASLQQTQRLTFSQQISPPGPKGEALHHRWMFMREYSDPNSCLTADVRYPELLRWFPLCFRRCHMCMRLDSGWKQPPYQQKVHQRGDSPG